MKTYSQRFRAIWIRHINLFMLYSFCTSHIFPVPHKVFFLLMDSSFHLGLFDQCNLLSISILMPYVVGQQLDLLEWVEISSFSEAVSARASTLKSPSDFD